MKYIHTIINNGYTAPYIEFVNRNFSENEHVFYIIRGLRDEKCPIPDHSNVFRIYSGKTLLNSFGLICDIFRAKKIILHGIFHKYLILLLFIFPFLTKKCNWVIWGGDLYDYLSEKKGLKDKIIEKIKSIVLSRVGAILTDVKGDYEFAKKWYHVTGVHKRVLYTMPHDFDSIEKYIGDVSTTNDTISICVGNSATDTNNHFEVFDILSKYGEGKVSVFTILSYGDMEYAQKVTAYGHKLFGENFRPITSYMAYEEYCQIMNSMDILVYDHSRQQAEHNILLGFFLQKKIFINAESPLFEYYKEKECEVFNLREVTSYNDLVHLTSEIKVNKDKFMIFQSEKRVKELWNNIFNL